MDPHAQVRNVVKDRGPRVHQAGGDGDDVALAISRTTPPLDSALKLGPMAMPPSDNSLSLKSSPPRQQGPAPESTM
jgi:hypothetical protein